MNRKVAGSFKPETTAVHHVGDDDTRSPERRGWPTLFATIDAVDNQRELAKLRFRAQNKWQKGTHSRTSIRSFYGAGTEHEHVREFLVDADHPVVLVAADNAPLPVELLLAALASCPTGDRQYRGGAGRRAGPRSSPRSRRSPCA